MRLFDTQSIARISGVPISTAKQRIGRAGVKPCAVHVIVSGVDEISRPLFSEGRLPEIVAIMRPRSVSAADTEATR